ncbi:MAG: hypothetical protein AAB309_02925 [Deltaproteobacteria bacterium]
MKKYSIKIGETATDVLSVVRRNVNPMLADIDRDGDIDDEDLALFEEELLKLKIAQEPIQKELIALHNELNNKSVFRELSEVPEYAVAELADMVGYAVETRDEETYRKIREKEYELRELERQRLSKYDLNGDGKLSDLDSTFVRKEKEHFSSGNLRQLTYGIPEDRFRYSTTGSRIDEPTAKQTS